MEEQQAAKARPRKSAQLGNTPSQHRRCRQGAPDEGQEGAFWSQALRPLFFAVLILGLCCHPRRSGLTFWPFLCLRRHLFLSFFPSFLERGTTSCNSHGEGAAALRPVASAHRGCRAPPHDPREAGPGAAPGGEAAAGRLPPRPGAVAAVTSPPPPSSPGPLDPTLPAGSARPGPSRPRRSAAPAAARPLPGRREGPAGSAPLQRPPRGPAGGAGARAGGGGAAAGGASPGGRRDRARRPPAQLPHGAGRPSPRRAAWEQPGTGDLLASGCQQLARAL